MSRLTILTYAQNIVTAINWSLTNETFRRICQATLSGSPSLRTVQMHLSTLKKEGLVESQGKGPNTVWKHKL